MHSPKTPASKWQHWDDLHRSAVPYSLAPDAQVHCQPVAQGHKGRAWHNTQLYLAKGSTSPESPHFPHLWWAALSCPNRTPLTWELPVGSCAICATPEVRGSSHRLFVQNRYSNTCSLVLQVPFDSFSSPKLVPKPAFSLCGTLFLGFF